jgi:rubrerythrin
MECITTDLTLVTLLKAFAGESQARTRYEYYAKVAQKEGYRDIAAYFQRAADNEKQHAKLELALHNRIKNNSEESWGDTLANLEDAIAGENYENLTMYPDFAAVAKEEGHSEAARLFKNIGQVEVEHEKMYRELLARLSEGHEFKSDDEEVWICEACGHVHYGKKAPQKCPVCSHPQPYFSRKVESK